MTKKILLAGLIALAAAGCGNKNEPSGNQPPTCSITSPADNAQFFTNENITIAVEADDKDGTVAEVRLYVDSVGNSSKKDFPYNFTIAAGELLAGAHAIKVVAKDNDGASAEATVNITIKLALGDSYQGGIVAYIDATGKHGLIAAPADQINGIKWWNDSYIVTGATGTAIGTGQSNTTKIVAAQGAGSYAAKLCDDLVLNGYSDWFLPSKDELNELYKNRVAIGANGVYYWSSSEYNSDLVWVQVFNGTYSGQQSSFYKTNGYSVRAVRAF